MTNKQILTILLLICFASCQRVMATMGFDLNDANYLFPFIIASASAGVIISLTK